MKVILARLFRLLPLPLTRGLVRLLNVRFTIGVVGVFYSANGKILILHHVYRRRYPWGLPAGFVKAGESPAEAAVREVKEETGLDVKATRVLAVYPIRPRYMEVAVLGTADGAQPIRPSHEIFEGACVAPGSLPSDMMPDQAELVRLAEGLKGALVTEA